MEGRQLTLIYVCKHKHRIQSQWCHTRHGMSESNSSTILNHQVPVCEAHICHVLCVRWRAHARARIVCPR